MPRTNLGSMEYAMEDFVRRVMASAALHGHDTRIEMAKACGMDYQTLQRRLMHPEQLRLPEILIIGKGFHMGQDGLEPVLKYWNRKG